MIQLFLVFSLLFLSGCDNRYYCWVKDVFNQGDPLEEYAEIPRCYMRLVRFYDQFTTVGIFDGLWLAAPVRQAYVDYYAEMHCLSSAEYQRMLSYEMEKARKISFYVLSFYPNQDECALVKAGWAIVLELDGRCIKPESIKKVDLPIEYQFFFGPRYTQFKESYEIIFDVPPVISHSMELVFRFRDREGAMTWCFDHGVLMKEVSCVRDRGLAYDVDCQYTSC